jgi:hypothetical protein
VIKELVGHCGRISMRGSFMEKFIMFALLFMVPDVAMRYRSLREEGVLGAILMGCASSLLQSLFFTIVWHAFSLVARKRK